MGNNNNCRTSYPVNSVTACIGREYISRSPPDLRNHISLALPHDFVLMLFLSSRVEQNEIRCLYPDDRETLKLHLIRTYPYRSWRNLALRQKPFEYVNSLSSFGGLIPTTRYLWTRSTRLKSNSKIDRKMPNTCQDSWSTLTISQNLHNNAVGAVFV